MKPRARKKASAISQGISDENALKAALKGNRPVTMETPRPIIAVAPRGRGCAVEGSWKSVSRQTVEREKLSPTKGREHSHGNRLELGRRVGDARW